MQARRIHVPGHGFYGSQRLQFKKHTLINQVTGMQDQVHPFQSSQQPRSKAARPPRHMGVRNHTDKLHFTLKLHHDNWLFICGSNVLVFRAVSQSPDFPHVVASTAVGRIISLVPVSIGGVGIK